MTDLQKTIALYKGFGIDLKHYERDTQKVLALNCPWTESENKGFGNINDKLAGGYHSCMSEMIFTKEGKFIKQCFWEG